MVMTNEELLSFKKLLEDMKASINTRVNSTGKENKQSATATSTDSTDKKAEVGDGKKK